MIEDLLQPRHLLIVIVLLGMVIVPAIFYLLTLQTALERCSVESRAASPGTVWLMLIPLFNLIWNFILVGQISRSLRNEFNRRGTQGVEADPGKSIGLAMCILAPCGIIPGIGFLSSIAGFICWIIYWVKISGYSRLLLAPAIGSATA
jgi:hypothetical protein